MAGPIDQAEFRNACALRHRCLRGDSLTRRAERMTANAVTPLSLEPLMIVCQHRAHARGGRGLRRFGVGTSP
jgi:hypothetical protein